MTQVRTLGKETGVVSMAKIQFVVLTHHVQVCKVLGQLLVWARARRKAWIYSLCRLDNSSLGHPQRVYKVRK